jgi:hypothetical protein
MMGKRYKGSIPEEMLEDQGLPGKLYFEEPAVINIAVVRNGNNVSTVNASDTEGPIRTLSIRGMRDFTKKEHNSYRVGQRPNLDEITDYLKWANIQGFGNGAVVARRFCAPWRAESHYQWGVILGEHNYEIPPHSHDMWYPYRVQWFDRGVNAEGAWAEDLFVIHQSLSRNLLDSILEEQQEGVT